MAKYSIEDTTLTNIADAIRTKTGNSDSIMVQDMASEIAGIKGEPTLQTKTVTPSTSSQTITPDSGYDGLSKVTVNAMPTATQATPSITVSSGGLITASATQSAGYVASGTKQATKQLTVQAAKTITPSTSSQTAVASGVYTTGAVTVAPIPSNYEDVGTETTEYTSLNDELEEVINSLPSAGGSGGSVETCTVEFTLGYNTAASKVNTGDMLIVYQTLNDNNEIITTCTQKTKTMTDTVIQFNIVDCVCNRFIVIAGMADAAPYSNTAIIEGSAQLVFAAAGTAFVFQSPTMGDEVCRITIAD